MIEEKKYTAENFIDEYYCLERFVRDFDIVLEYLRTGESAFRGDYNDKEKEIFEEFIYLLKQNEEQYKEISNASVNLKSKYRINLREGLLEEVKKYLKDDAKSIKAIENLFKIGCEFFDEKCLAFKKEFKKYLPELKEYFLDNINEKIEKLERDLTKVKEILYSSSRFNEGLINSKWKENEDLFINEYINALKDCKAKVLKYVEEAEKSETPEDEFSYDLYDIIYYIEENKIQSILENRWDFPAIMKQKSYWEALASFKKFYDKEEAERFFDKIRMRELESENQKLKEGRQNLENEKKDLEGKLTESSQSKIIKEFKPIGEKAENQDKYYTKLKWCWLGGGIIFLFLANLWLDCSGFNFSKATLIPSITYRIPWVVVFWVGLTFISRRQREAHKEYVYFSHLYHLLNAMIETSISVKDEVVKQEYIKAGMSHLASSPLSAIYKDDKNSDGKLAKELLKRINFHVNK